jgi:Cu+-exporting ATPase
VVTDLDSQWINSAAALEKNSTHPIAQAIVEKASAPIPEVTSFENIPGKGVTGIIGSTRYYLGSLRFASEKHPLPSPSQKNKTSAALFTDEKILALFSIEDPLKSTSKEAVDQLKNLEIKPILITGDHSETARAIAKEAGIQDFYADCLPDEKAKIIHSLRSPTLKVGMVGDGINDAPALAAADVGFAMGTGSDIAIETASVTVMNDDLTSIVKAITIAKDTYKKIKQNLAFAFLYNVLAIPLAALGFLNPMIAAAAMALSSLSVLLNSLRR